jgi:hypothetical protein
LEQEQEGFAYINAASPQGDRDTFQVRYRSHSPLETSKPSSLQEIIFTVLKERDVSQIQKKVTMKKKASKFCVRFIICKQ